MNLYVVRHGQTDWNIQNKIQGFSDIPLNATGLEQANNLKEQLSKFSIDKIYASPLIRTVQTANILNEVFHVPIELENRLIERNFGIYEGTVAQINLADYFDYEKNLSTNDVEPIQDLFHRVWSFLDELIEKHPNENILLVTHGGTYRAIYSYFYGILSASQILSCKLHNCEVHQFIGGKYETK